MSLFEYLKAVHVGCALLSVSGFALRGYWRLSDSPCVRHRLTKVLPHLLDTLLLGSAVGMLSVWGVSPFAFPWLTAKLTALLIYIGLGMVVMRFASTWAVQCLAYIAALAVAAYMISVAYTKSALGVLVFLGG